MKQKEKKSFCKGYNGGRVLYKLLVQFVKNTNFKNAVDEK